MARGLTLKLMPYISKKVWGWKKWVLSCHEDGKTTIEEGIYSGQELVSKEEILFISLQEVCMP